MKATPGLLFPSLPFLLSFIVHFPEFCRRRSGAPSVFGGLEAWYCWHADLLFVFCWLGEWTGILAGNVLTLFKYLLLKGPYKMNWLNIFQKPLVSNCPTLAIIPCWWKCFPGQSYLLYPMAKCSSFIKLSCRLNSLSLFFFLGKLIPHLLCWGIHRNSWDL